MILLEKLGELELIELIALAILGTCYFPDALARQHTLILEIWEDLIGLPSWRWAGEAEDWMPINMKGYGICGRISLKSDVHTHRHSCYPHEPFTLIHRTMVRFGWVQVRTTVLNRILAYLQQKDNICGTCNNFPTEKATIIRTYSFRQLHLTIGIPVEVKVDLSEYRLGCREQTT